LTSTLESLIGVIFAFLSAVSFICRFKEIYRLVCCFYCSLITIQLMDRVFNIINCCILLVNSTNKIIEQHLSLELEYKAFLCIVWHSGVVQFVEF